MNRRGNNRQSFLGENLDEILENNLIGIIGLGGGGSQVVQQLAHIGFQQYVLCDFDYIEGTNLNRLVGATVEDVTNATLKIDIAERLIKGIVPEAKITKITDRFQRGLSKLKNCNLIFGCLDGLSNRAQLEGFTRLHQIPYVDVGMDVIRHPEDLEAPRMSGQVIASLPDKPCMRCYGYITENKLQKEEHEIAYGGAGERPQVIWPNGTLTSTAVGLAMNILTNWTRNNHEQILYFSYDGNSGELTKHLFYDRQKKANCIHYSTEGI